MIEHGLRGPYPTGISYGTPEMKFMKRLNYGIHVLPMEHSIHIALDSSSRWKCITQKINNDVNKSDHISSNSIHNLMTTIQNTM